MLLLLMGLSKEAFVVTAICDESKKTYGITVDSEGLGQYVFHWAFPIDSEKAHREGYDVKSVHGSVSIDKNFPGCPYCGSRDFIFCGNCGSVMCYHGQRRSTCLKCGCSGEVSSVEGVDLKGGSF